MIEQQFTDPEASDLGASGDLSDKRLGGDVDFSFSPEDDSGDLAADADWPVGMDMPSYLSPLGGIATDPMADFEADIDVYPGVVAKHRADAEGGRAQPSSTSAGNVADYCGEDPEDAPAVGSAGGGNRPPQDPTFPTGGEFSDSEGEGGDGDHEIQDSQPGSKRELVVTFDLGGVVLSSTLNGVDLEGADTEPVHKNSLGVARAVGETLPLDEREQLLERRRLGRVPPTVRVDEEVLVRVLHRLRDEVTGQDDPGAKRYVYVPRVTPEDIAKAGGDPLLALARKAEEIDAGNPGDTDAS